tara:strand:+ start:297 stop:506 length:210 start_codon:yes stop_codon:yes gene_type:complete
MKQTQNKIIKECIALAKRQGLTFKRSTKVGTINGNACYEIESGVQFKTLQTGYLRSIHSDLLSGDFAGQ